MTATSGLEAEWGELYGALAKAFAAGNQKAFLDALDSLGAAREDGLYRELREMTSKMTNSLRFALEQFRMDSRLSTLAGREVPDARVRLDHVLKLTEEGAHRTLDLVERSCPLADRTAKDAAALVTQMQARGGAGPELEGLLTRVDNFLSAAQRDSDAVRSNLNEVLMAQSYQDLSGQIIRGVITLVSEVEKTLSHFASLAGDASGKSTAAAAAPQEVGNGFGPAIPGITKDAMGEQVDVDALLADLGM